MKKTLVLFKILLLSVLAQALYSYSDSKSSRSHSRNHSFPPLIEPHTARTLGKGNNEVNLSLSVFIPKQLQPFSDFSTFFDFATGVGSASIEYTRGLSDHFDLAVFTEIQDNLSILLGLAGMHQWVRHEQHTLSFLFSAGLNKGYNKLSMNPHTEEYDPEEYKKAAEESLLGFFIYAGPVYSFKANEKYELAFNIRINHSYSQALQTEFFGGNFRERLSAGLAEGLRKSLADNWFLRLTNPGLDEPIPQPPRKEGIEKSSIHLLYGSANMSNTWWFTPSFGATVSLAVAYPFYVNSKYSDLILFKPSFNIHTQF